MAGHSKWANIKHKKAKVDAQRGKIFTRLIRELTIAARMGGGDVMDNPRLRLAVSNAKNSNMPKDTMQRAIDRGVGGEGENLEEITYEGYGQAGVAVLVETMTDNRNRTVAEVRHAFSKFGGNLGTDGSVAYLFTKKGQITFEPGADEDKILEIALEFGAEDVQTNDDESIDVVTAPEDFEAVKDALETAGFEPVNAEVAMIPATTVELDAESGESVMKLIDMLEELDDVQNVYSNAEFPEEMMG
ncbi:MAG: YebC/PmpR family DNA-binding transcriptional regulator [Pseudomonadales bacterium]|nr:YebC/PmpR family DNA-binding transcriptional regulator [Pseudomonadales bacterium]MCP5215321.1 YebC/PmpR family DNA-binding transcriptional regulator [Pseudomonadales bacterium]